jgi:hypothetical protein
LITVVVPILGISKHESPRGCREIGRLWPIRWRIRCKKMGSVVKMLVVAIGSSDPSVGAQSILVA